MGKKKDKNAKKGKGAEKTAMKTEKKAEKKAKKQLKERGEKNIEALIEEMCERSSKRVQVVEEKVCPPSARCNMVFLAHPDKEELIMFGGEYFNGNKTVMYNDLYFYNIKSNEWTHVKAPNAPPPRSAHQGVILRQGGGQLWIFGGEFASPSQSQFYHYKDLWVYHLRDKRWEKISAPGGPSPRSGHRMAVCKRYIIIFGGFHDNIREYKYFNDVFAFNLDTFTWVQLEPTGTGPSPRSGCQIATTLDQSTIVVYGGYSKERLKKDVDLGHIHTDMFILTQQVKLKDGKEEVRWKWSAVKQHGTKPSPRCGFSLVATPGDRALMFGGVHDEKEDEEDVEGVFFNEMYSLELDKGMWHEIRLKGKRSNTKEKKRRRRKKEGDEGMDVDAEDDGDEEEEMDEVMENLTVTEEKQTVTDKGGFKVSVGPQTTFDDGIFTVTVAGPSTKAEAPNNKGGITAGGEPVFVPSPRMNAHMAVKGSMLYLYGGKFEDGDRILTLADMYSLDLHKLNEWTTLISDENVGKDWEDSDSSSDEDEEMEGAARIGQPHSSSDDDSDMEDEETPTVRSNESLSDYFSRSKDYWMDFADDAAEKNNISLSTKQLKKKKVPTATLR